MRALQAKLPARGPERAGTPRDLLAGAGRAALWLAVGMLLVRGRGRDAHTGGGCARAAGLACRRGGRVAG